MKRFFALAFSLLAALALVACATAPATPPAEEAAVAEPVIVEVAEEVVAEPEPETVEAAPAEIPEGEIISLDNFEEGNYWVAVGDSWDQWGSHNLSLEAELFEEWGTDGPTSADWVYDTIPATGGQATFFCDQLLETDWTGAKSIVIDINNPESFAITIVFSTQTTDGWTWSQTKTIEIQPGITENVAFDLTSGLLDGNNQAIEAIPGLDMVKRAMFSVMLAGDGKAGRFYVDNIRLIK